MVFIGFSDFLRHECGGICVIIHNCVGDFIHLYRLFKAFYLYFLFNSCKKKQNALLRGGYRVDYINTLRSQDCPHQITDKTNYNAKSPIWQEIIANKALKMNVHITYIKLYHNVCLLDLSSQCFPYILLIAQFYAYRYMVCKRIYAVN